jgi:hypothetical protein
MSDRRYVQMIPLALDDDLAKARAIEEIRRRRRRKPSNWREVLAARPDGGTRVIVGEAKNPELPR